MKMEDLNKTQIVLLTLLTSFVTSIATGIVTVTLMDQAPPAVTRTINRVIEKTIQTVIPGENKVTTVVKKVIIKEKDLLVGVVERASKSLVQIDAVGSDGKKVSLGVGVVISADGFIIADKNRIDGNRHNLSISQNGKSVNVEVVSKEKDFVILHLKKVAKSIPPKKSTAKDIKNKIKSTNLKLTPISLIDSDTVKLGQTVIALGGGDGETVFTGIVSRLDKEVPVVASTNIDNTLATSTNGTIDKSTKIATSKDINSENIKILKYIVPSFKIDKQGAGGPLLDTDGSLIGINVITSDGKTLSIPSNEIEKSLLNVTKNIQNTLVNSKNSDESKSLNKKDNLTNGK